MLSPGSHSHGISGSFTESPWQNSCSVGPTVVWEPLGSNSDSSTPGDAPARPGLLEMVNQFDP